MSNLFKNNNCFQKPRERFENVGVNNLTDEELIAIILKTGYKNMNVMEVSRKLLNGLGGLNKLKDVGVSKLMNINGIGRVKAIELKTIVEIGNRIFNNNESIIRIKFDNPNIIFNYFKNILVDKKQEFFYVVYLDNKKYIIDKKCLFIGTINNSIIHPREIFKEAYLLSASSFVCVHNHPSGDPNPSKEDILVTKKIKEIGLIHGIYLVDHIIIGKENYYSFYDNNLM